MKVVLFEPQIPNNTGNIGRLCLGTRSELHLIEPLGYELSDKYLKRAGLDYWQHLKVKVHSSWNSFLDTENPHAVSFFSAKASQNIYQKNFIEDEYLVFGRESDGLPEKILETYPADTYKIPVLDDRLRSFNLANAVSIVLFESLRQTHFLE